MLSQRTPKYTSDPIQILDKTQVCCRIIKATFVLSCEKSHALGERPEFGLHVVILGIVC